jgi:hypothetical protein
VYALDRHEPEIACSETQIRMHPDFDALGVLREGALHEQAILIGQQVESDLEETIPFLAEGDDALFRCECGEALDVSQVKRLVGLGLYIAGPGIQVAECLPLARDEQLGRGALSRVPLLRPAVRRELHGPAAD